MRDVKESKMKGIERDLELHVSLIPTDPKYETVKSKTLQRIEEKKQEKVAKQEQQMAVIKKKKAKPVDMELD